MANQIVWFDMPVKELDRAIRFYSAVLGAPVKKEEMPGMTFAVLPHENNEIGGCLTPGGEGDDASHEVDRHDADKQPGTLVPGQLGDVACPG